MPSHSPETELGAFIPTTDVYDVDTIYDMDVNSSDFKDFLVRLRQSINNVAMVLNIKDTGYYPKTEFVCSKSWFPNPALNATTAQTPTMRQVFRKVFEFSGLFDNATRTIPHGITIGTGFPVKFTDIYGTANNTNTYHFIPLPYSGTDLAWGNVSISIDANNIYITTTTDMTAFTIGYIVVEWIKQ